MLALGDIESANSRSNMHSDPGGGLVADLQAGGLHGLFRGRHGQLDEAAHLLDVFLLDEFQRVKILDLAGNLAGVLRGVKMSDRSDAALAGQQVCPDLFGGVAHREIRPTPVTTTRRANYFPPFACLPM